MDVFFTRHSFIYLIILIVVGCDAPLEEGNSLPINSLNTSLIEDYGLSPNNDDHDGDGLLNQWEITYSGNYYNPALKDTTDNGIEDNREDYDNDGLDSLAEQGAGTSPFLSDTDGDNLNDDREIELGTNPNLIDTDGDGIPDGVEVGAALDPLSVATDGQLDAEKSINNTIAIVDGSTLSIRGVYNPEPGIRLSVEVGDETTGLENGDKIYRVLLTEDTGLESDSLTISIPFIAETSEELLIQFYSPELGWSNLPDNVSINVDLENKMAEITLSADQFTSLFSSNSENVIQQKNNRALAQKTAGYISTIPAMFTVRNLENAFLAISKFVNKPDVTPDFYYDFSSSESKNVTINDSELTYVDSTIYPDSQAVILDGETSIDLALSNAPIIEDYTINIYLEDISKPGVLLKNSAENGTSYNYLYIQTAKNDISTITYIKKGQELITYINGLEEQRIQGNDNNSILPLNHNINIGTPIFGCSFDIDLSHCDFNTPINGIVNRVEIFSQVMEPESIRAHLSDYYTNRFGETDTDLDKITDAEEIVGILLIDGAVNFTNRLIADSDEDGIIDGDEVSRLYPFELSIANKNNVALKAAFKFGNSTCPLLYSFCLPSFDYSFSTPILFSKNTYRVSKTSPTTKDTDQDGLSDIDEYDIGTSPIIKDSDSDGIIDGDELYIDTDPTMFDTDGDGLGDGLEHYATALELDPTFPDDLTFEFDENKYQLLKKYVAANYTLNSPEGWDKVKNFFLFSYASIAQEFNETANQNIYTNKIINNSELAAFHNYFKLSGVDKDYFQNKASEIAERINHKKTAHIIVGLLKGFDLGEPENQYELAGQFLNIPIYFIPGVEIPFTVRDILGLTYQGEVPEAILSAVSLIPIAGVAADSEKAAIQVTKAIQSASKINPANVQQLLARLTSKIQLFSDSHAKELLALQFGAELYMLLGEDEPESSLINSERGRDTQQRLSERGSILRLSLSDVQRLMLNVPTDKLKGIAKLLEKDVGVNVNKMPETVIHNPKVFIQYGLFLRKLGIKHWRSGELYHLDKFKKLYENNPNAIVSEQQHFFDLNAAGLTSGSLDDLRKPDVSIKNTGANGNIGYDLHEVKVGAIGKNERILSEIDRDCRMLNQGAKQRKNGVIVSAVVNKVVWNFYPSGGTESKVIFGLSDSLLDFLSCKKDKHGKPTDYGTDTKGIDIELFLPNSDAIKQFKLAQKSTEFRTESLGLINLDMDGTTDTSTSSGAIGGINSGSDPLSLITEERVLYTGSSYGEKQISFSLPDIVYSLTPVSLSVLEIPGYDLNSYQVTWEQIAGIAIDLTNSTSNSVSFIAPETLEGNEDIILRLSVINGNSVLTHDQIISIIPRLPITYSLETSDLNVIPTLKISFPEITDATQINIYYATEENVLPENWSLLNDGSYRQEICIPVATSENQFKADAGGEIAVTFCPDVFDVYFEIEGANIETETNFTLRSGQSYYFTLSSTINGEELIHDYNHRVTINSFDPEAETPLIPLNDTGITWGANYPAGNNTTCIGETIEEQDCSYGRDAQAAAGTLSKVGGGHAGFDFTKLDASGAPLTDQTQDYISNPWACVKDNHTGLVWEVKTDDDGIHDKDLTYRWGGKTALLNAPFGTVYNDWDALVDASNNKTFCGFSDWRVPSKLELTSIVNFNRILPAIETNFFPNTTSGLYWSASLDSDNSIAMSVYFKDGLGYPASLRYNQNHVRIVRGGE